MSKITILRELVEKILDIRKWVAFSSSIASCFNHLSKYSYYIFFSREPNFWSSIHDIKLLILRFTTEASFCQDSGGGSKYSNIRFLSYMFGYSFYLLQASRSFQKEFNNLALFLENESEKCITSSYELDGPVFFLVSSIFLMSGEEWSLNKIKFLRRVIITGHARCISSKVQSGNAQEPLDFNFYRYN